MIENFLPLLETSFWNNTVLAYLIAFGVFIGIRMGIGIGFYIALGGLKKLAEKTSSEWDDRVVRILESVSPWFKKYIAFWAGMQFLVVPEKLSALLNAGLIIIAIFEVVKLASIFIEFGFEAVTSKKNKTAITGLQLMAKIALWSLGLLLILSNLGVEISALVASMGIGGIAVALAAQNILGDLFSSFTIYFDKPFEIGDFIVIGADSGTVEKIGLKSSRIRTLQGEELIVSNKELTGIRIQNFKKMKRRRLCFTIGVEYGTAQAKMKKIPDLIETIVNGQEGAEFSRCHFATFGDFSLNFEVVYFVESPEYEDFMEVQQSVNLAIKEAFEKEKIEMAFPSQTIFVKQ